VERKRYSRKFQRMAALIGLASRNREGPEGDGPSHDSPGTGSSRVTYQNFIQCDLRGEP
jgi:hypothetical protein